MTNGDFLRSKSNEWLAEFLGESMACLKCPIRDTHKPGKSCFRTWLDWLNAHRPEPVEDHAKAVMSFCESFNNRCEQERKALQSLQEAMHEATEAYLEPLRVLANGLGELVDKLEQR